MIERLLVPQFDSRTGSVFLGKTLERLFPTGVKQTIERCGGLVDERLAIEPKKNALELVCLDRRRVLGSYA